MSSVKSFLCVFLNFEMGTENKYSLNINLFIYLVRLVGEALDYFVHSLQVYLYRRKVHTETPSNIAGPFEKDVIVTLNLLPSLYVLNCSWHQWFDVAEEHKIINEYLFENSTFIKGLDYVLRKDHNRLTWFIEMIKLCPAVVQL